MKKIFLSLFVVSALLLFAATAGAKSLEAPIFEQPALITAVGQSADAQLANILFKKAGVEYTLKALAKPGDLAGAKTLVLVIGGSSKGLGAAGINASEEAARAQSLIDAAKQQGIKILAMHIGGENRRGDLTDRYIGPSLANAEYAIVVKAGDKDGMFAKGMEGKYIDFADKINEVSPIVKKAFK